MQQAPAEEKGVQPDDLVVFRTSSQKGMWVCPKNGVRQTYIQDILNGYFDNLKWNKNRFCWVLPRYQGEQFYEQELKGHSEDLHTEGDKDIAFPMFPDYRAPLRQQNRPLRERGREEKKHSQEQQAIQLMQETVRKIEERLQKLETTTKQMSDYWRGFPSHSPSSGVFGV
jgi:hypothetical protein